MDSDSYKITTQLKTSVSFVLGNERTGFEASNEREHTRVYCTGPQNGNNGRRGWDYLIIYLLGYGNQTNWTNYNTIN